VSADGARLTELVTLLDEGVLAARVAETYALDEAAKAHARLGEGVRGRLVLVPRRFAKASGVLLPARDAGGGRAGRAGGRGGIVRPGMEVGGIPVVVAPFRV